MQGLIAGFSRAAARLKGLGIPLHAAHTGYFLILSLFPGMVLLLSLLRYAGLDIHSLLRLLEGVIPQALLPEAELLIYNTYENTTSVTVGISAATALWSASRGIHGLMTALGAIYHTQQDRSWLKARLLSMGYTLAFLLVLLLTLVLHIFGASLLGLLEGSSLAFLRFLAAVVDLRFFLLVGLQAGVFTAMFYALPGHRTTLAQSLPGALLASIGWLVFSHLFSLYVEHFSRYGRIYGSVYALALGMLWLYCCISILFYGAALNRLLEEKPQKEENS